ncbi:MAG: quinolinate synthase NadA [Candidatus Micrarchaeota archaeon]
MGEFKPSSAELDAEAKRLYSSLSKLGWNKEVCQAYAPLTLEINNLKKRKNAVILAHSYQPPEIVYGVADFVGDSLGLSMEAARTKAKVIVFAGVRFMAETAKILSPTKKVYLPATDAGCSLAESITAADVRKLRKKHPGAGVVCYVNTDAAVKAECDACCTSANALEVVESMPQEKVIFLPDAFMARNVAALTKKQIIGWDGKCVVHREFSADKIRALRKAHPGMKVLVHTECAPAVVKEADYAGGTGGMIGYAKASNASEFVMVTECGLSDRMRVELPGKKFLAMCSLCPFMRKNSLALIWQALAKPKKSQEIIVPKKTVARARRAIDYMMQVSSSGTGGG